MQRGLFIFISIVIPVYIYYPLIIITIMIFFFFSFRLFRRGRARKELGHYDEAMDDFKKCLQVMKKEEEEGGKGGGGTVRAVKKEMEALKPLIAKAKVKTDRLLFICFYLLLLLLLLFCEDVDFIN